MKQIALLFALCSFTLINAQTIGKEYKRLTNLAEIEITNNEYANALKHYKEAFKRTAFTVDLYNAAACAAKLNDRQTVYFYSQKLSEKGVGEKFFNKKIFRTFKNDPAFIKIMTLAEQTQQKNAKANAAYYKQIQGFITLDSTYNRLRLTKYRDLDHNPDTLENLFRINTQNLMAFIKENGFYSEKKMGAIIANDTVVRYRGKGDIILLHYLGMGRDSRLTNEIKTMMLDNLNDGTSAHYNLTHIMELTDRVFGETGMWIFKINECKLYRKKEIEQLDEINQLRDTYNLESITDLEKKLIFKYSTNNDFDFRYDIIRAPVHDKEFFYSAFGEIAKVKGCY